MLSAHRFFSCKFSHKIALVRCPRAFRLRRLAQSAWLALAGIHFSWQAQYFVDLDTDLCDVHVHFDQNRKQQITLAALLTTASEGVRDERAHLGSCVLIVLSVAQAGSVLGG